MKDLETLYQIERECFTIEAFSKEHIALLLKNPNCVGLVAKVNSEIAGFIIGLAHSNILGTKMGHIYTLDVAVKHRRKGIGLKLLEALEKTFSEKGVKTCYLEVRVDNVAARELYDKRGYSQAETLEDYYRKGVHGVRLTKLLGAAKSSS